MPGRRMGELSYSAIDRAYPYQVALPDDICFMPPHAAQLGQRGAVALARPLRCGDGKSAASMGPAAVLHGGRHTETIGMDVIPARPSANRRPLPCSPGFRGWPLGHCSRPLPLIGGNWHRAAGTFRHVVQPRPDEFSRVLTSSVRPCRDSHQEQRRLLRQEGRSRTPAGRRSRATYRHDWIWRDRANRQYANEHVVVPRTLLTLDRGLLPSFGCGEHCRSGSSGGLR